MTFSSTPCLPEVKTRIDVTLSLMLVFMSLGTLLFLFLTDGKFRIGVIVIISFFVLISIILGLVGLVGYGLYKIEKYPETFFEDANEFLSGDNFTNFFKAGNFSEEEKIAFKDWNNYNNWTDEIKEKVAETSSSYFTYDVVLPLIFCFIIGKSNY